MLLNGVSINGCDINGSLSLSGATYTASVSELTTASDAVSATAIFVAALVENASASDTPDAFIGHQYFVSTEDYGAATDSPDAGITKTVDVVDLAVASDLFEALITSVLPAGQFESEYIAFASDVGRIVMVPAIEREAIVTQSRNAYAKSHDRVASADAGNTISLVPVHDRDAKVH